MRGENAQRLSYWVLGAGLVAALVLFGVRIEYRLEVRFALAGIQFVVILVAAWKLGLHKVVVEADARGMLAAAAGLLIAPFALFALLAGIGPPGLQSDADNELRYWVLLVGAIATASGFVVLRESLIVAGERFYSTLGFCATLFAGPMYVMFLTTQILVFHTPRSAVSAQEPVAFVALDELSMIFLFLGSLLTYVATAAFGASLGRTQWLDRRVAGACIVLALIALLSLVMRGPDFPNRTEALTRWYTMVGWVVGIPAVPWMIPCAFGVMLLRHAGRSAVDAGASRGSGPL